MAHGSHQKAPMTEIMPSRLEETDEKETLGSYDNDDKIAHAM
jgi:hypothetical protein